MYEHARDQKGGILFRQGEEDSELLQFNGVAILARCEQETKFGYELLTKFAALMSVRLDAARQKMMDEWNPAGYA